jgi:hypothetical protein
MPEKCVKCNYEKAENIKFNFPICNICNKFAPNTENEFNTYINEKVPSEILETFRKYAHASGELQKKGMSNKAAKGSIMSRPAFGYKFENSILVPAENFREVEEIFEEFLNSNSSLTQLAAKRSFSVNGLKKILSNFTYIGKVKFNGQIHQGNHQPIVSSTLFNHVQNKLEKLGIKKI